MKKLLPKPFDVTRYMNKTPLYFGFDFIVNKRHGPMIVVNSDDVLFNVYYWLDGILVSELDYLRYLAKINAVARELLLPDLGWVVKGYIAPSFHGQFAKLIETAKLPEEIAEIIYQYNS